MIIKRTNLFSENKKLSENTKDNISTAIGAGLGAGSGYLIVKKINPDNLQKLANKIEWKTIKTKGGAKASKFGLKDYNYLTILEERGPKAKKLAEVIRSEKLAKLSKNPAVKAAVIGGAALGVGAGVRKSIKNKN